MRTSLSGVESLARFRAKTITMLVLLGLFFSQTPVTGQAIPAAQTFLAAVENPRSLLYTENLTGKVCNAAAYYGSVCSAYTSYALGCGFPYQKGSSVKFNVMDRDRRDVKTLVIQRGDEAVEAITLDDLGLHERNFTTCGDYTAHVIYADGSPSQACEFAVCDLDLRLPSESISMSQEWQADFHSENMNVIAVYLWNSGDSYGRHPIFLTDEQRKTGSITIPAGLLKNAGTLQVWLIGEHPLGRLKMPKDIRLVP